MLAYDSEDDYYFASVDIIFKYVDNPNLFERFLNMFQAAYIFLYD